MQFTLVFQASAPAMQGFASQEVRIRLASGADWARNAVLRSL
jgi:hypothetical protein